MLITPFTPRRKFQQKGFTLIELMIAIAIVGVLAAIAVPAFANYLARARVAEAINYAQGCKAGYIEFYATNGTLPANNIDANCPSITTQNVDLVRITSTTGTGGAPAIRVRLSADASLPTAIRGHEIVLQPLNPQNQRVQAGQQIQAWRCALVQQSGAQAAAAAQDLVPAICKNPVIG